MAKNKRSPQTKANKAKAGKGKGKGGTPKRPAVPTTAAKGKNAKKARVGGKKGPKDKSRAAAKVRRLVAKAYAKGTTKTQKKQYLSEARKTVKAANFRTEARFTKMISTGRGTSYNKIKVSAGKKPTGKAGSKKGGGKKPPGKKANKRRIKVTAAKSPKSGKAPKAGGKVRLTRRKGK